MVLLSPPLLFFLSFFFLFFVLFVQVEFDIYFINQASGSLIAGSIGVNPWNTDELSDALRTALAMDREGRKSKHDLLYKYLFPFFDFSPSLFYYSSLKLTRYATKYTASYWGDSFIKELRKFTPLQPGSMPASPTLRGLLNKNVRTPFPFPYFQDDNNRKYDENNYLTSSFSASALDSVF